MEDAWICIDEDISSSNSFLSDSDKVDSETEAQLYSVVHHEENLYSLNNCDSGLENVQIPEVRAVTSDKVNDVICTEKKRENVRTESGDYLMSIPQSDGNNSAEKRKMCSETIFVNKLAQKLNPTKKKKSDSIYKVSNVLYSDSSIDTNFNQSPKNATLNNKQKRKNQCSAKKNEVIDSSDSEIWLELDSLAERDFQTNLCNDEDMINLSSDNEFNILPSSKSSMPDLKNLSMPNIKVGENSKDIWFVCNEDLYKEKKNKSRRYHDNYEITCANCNRKGHNSKICPVSKIIRCFICGQVGHRGAQCLNRVCSKCFRMGHTSRRCYIPCMSFCTLCNLKHLTENCPDLWRRYHMTTKPGRIVRAKPVKHSKYISCTNCGLQGHFAAACQEPRRPQNSISTWPCVVSYDDPEKILRKRLNGCSGKRGSFQNDLYLKMRYKTCETTDFSEEKKFIRKKNKYVQYCKQNQKSEQEKNFPRTPKSNIPLISLDDLPESVKAFKKENQRRRRQKNRRQKLKQKQKLLIKAGIIAGNT